MICGPIDLSPYASSEGITNSHLSPSDINCMASVQPLITWFGANFVGSLRLYEESNSSPCLFKKEKVCVCEKEREREHARAIVEYFISKRGRYARASRRRTVLLRVTYSFKKTSLSNIEKVVQKSKTRSQIQNHPRHRSPLLGRRLPYLDGRPSVVAQTRRVHFRFRSSFRSRFQTLYCNPDGKVVTPSFKAFSARNAFPASVVPPAAARFAEESAQEDDEERNERAEEFFVVGARVISLFCLLS